MLRIFFSKRFDEKYKHTDVALNFVLKQCFCQKHTFYFHFSQSETPCPSKMLFLPFLPHCCKISRPYLVPIPNY